MRAAAFNRCMIAVARLLKCMAAFDEGEEANMPEVAEELLLAPIGLLPFVLLLLFKNAAVNSSAFC